MKTILKSPHRNTIFIGLVVFLITSFFSQGYFHPDEHFQILELSNYKLGLSSINDLTWEFSAQIRPTLQPTIVVIFSKALNLLGINSPFVIITIIRMLTTLLTWFIITKIALLFEKDLKTKTAVKALYLFLFGLWFMPLLSARFSSENYSSLMLLTSIYLIKKYLQEHSKRETLYLIISGFLLGLSFWFRFQIAFSLIGLGLWLLFVAKISPRKILLLLSGFCLSMLFGFLIDVWFYQEIIFTPYLYFTANIIDNVAATWGVDPWYYYIIRLNLDTIPPIGFILFTLFIIGIVKNPKNILSFVLIPFVLAHMYVGHKEFRFLFPIVVPFIILAIYGFDHLLKNKEFARPWKIFANIIVTINIIILLAIMFTPIQNAIPYYKYAYNISHDKEYSLISETKPFYELVGQKVNFYKSDNIYEIVLEDSIQIAEYLEINKPENILILERNIALEKTYKNYTVQSSYCNFPQWITKLDFNGWVGRAKIWRIKVLVRE